MINDEILREIKSLPLEAQKQIEDFIAFLSERYKKTPSKSAPTSDLEAEVFVGMWKDREDMRDASVWIRNLRETHWGK